MTFNIGPGIQLGSGITISNVPSPWITYWYTDFETGSLEKTAGIASTGTSTTGDVWFDQSSGSVTTADPFQGSYSYFLNSISQNRRLRAAINRAVVDTYSEFKVEFQFKRTQQASTASWLLEMGAPASGVPSTGAGVQLTWLNNTTYIGFNASNQSVDTIPNQAIPAWANPAAWNKISVVYKRIAQTTEIAVNDVVVFGPHPSVGPWANYQSSPNRIAVSLYNRTNQVVTNAGIEGYLDNLGFYVKP